MVNDVTTTSTIKTRLARMQGMSTMTQVRVTTRDDMVYLTGTVADEAERKRIDAIARDVAGDNRVVNNLAVTRGAAVGAASPAADSKR
jgi:osmotically-inducible protein OsmY